MIGHLLIGKDDLFEITEIRLDGGRIIFMGSRQQVTGKPDRLRINKKVTVFGSDGKKMFVIDNTKGSPQIHSVTGGGTMTVIFPIGLDNDVLVVNPS